MATVINASSNGTTVTSIGGNAGSAYALQAPPPGVTQISTGASSLPPAWHSACCDCCAEPGGLETFCYAFWCSCCAAGDVAIAAGRDYTMSCLVAPCIVPFLAGVSIHSCVWCSDRQALAARYGVKDDTDPCLACMGFFFCCVRWCPPPRRPAPLPLFSFPRPNHPRTPLPPFPHFQGTCLLAQELNHIKKHGVVRPPLQTYVVVTQQPIQHVMGGYPAHYAPAPQYSYPPQYAAPPVRRRNTGPPLPRHKPTHSLVHPYLSP